MVSQFDGFEINPIHGGDAWKICDLMVANADRFIRYFPKTLEQNLNPTLSQLFVEKKVKQFNINEEFLFTLKHSETRKLAGLIYIKELDWDKKQGEFAYCIDYTFKAKGLMSKAVERLSKYAFEDLGLKILQIIVHKDNVGSVKVATNNGFEWQQTNSKGFTPPGEQPLDMELYELYMPHFVIDCSENILTLNTPENTLLEVHKAAIKSSLFDEGDIKVRFNVFAENYIVGGKKNDFIHVFANIMEGRTTEQKANLAKEIISRLKAIFPSIGFIAINIRDFEKATYCNKTMV